MSDPKSISVEAANDLMQQGYVYVDVRSEPEFENAHVPGALNVPLAHHTPQGMQPNPEFLSVMESSFGKHEKLILGCKSGGRSKRALALLVQAGFSEALDMSAGFEGARDAFGRPLKGWLGYGLPVESGKPEGQSYQDVKRRSPAPA